MNVKNTMRVPSEHESIYLWKLRNKAIQVGCHRSFSEDVIKALTPDEEPLWHRIALSNPNHYSLVIYEEGTPVSCGTLDLANKMIKSVFTSPEKTGQGLAGFIINALKDRAKLYGIAKLSLASSPNAIDFYKKYSFRLIGEKKIWSEQAKVWIPCVEMHCDL